MMLDLDIEYCTMCRCDGVRFWEWGLPLEPEDAIGNFCGIDVDIPDPFTAQGSHVYARFFSDDMYEYRGFLARFGFSIESSGMFAWTLPLASHEYFIIYPGDFLCQVRVTTSSLCFNTCFNDMYLLE